MFLQYIDGSIVWDETNNTECSYGSRFKTNGDGLIKHLEKVLKILCPSISFDADVDGYLHIEITICWQEGTMQIPLVTENIQQQRIMRRAKLLKQEIIEKALAPERVAKWLEHGDETLNIMMGVH